MAIVKGSGGILTYVGSLLTAYDHTILVRVKDVDFTGIYGRYLAYKYDTTNDYFTRMLVSDGTTIAATLFGYSMTATETPQATPGDWRPLVSHGNSTDRFLKLTTSQGTFSLDTAAYSPPFITEDTPQLEVLEGATMPTGTKIGEIIICSAELTSQQIANLMAGTLDPSTLPSLVEHWHSNVGVVDDGSGNLVTWTGANGTVLTPSGTITVDADDPTPEVGPSLTNPTDPIEFSSTGNTVVANAFTGDLSSLTDQDSGYAYTITNQSGGDPNTVTFNAFDLFAMIEASGGIPGPSLPNATLLATYTPTDPDETATVAINTSLPTGYSSVVLSGSSNAGGTIGFGLNEVHTVLTSDGDICVFPTANNTIVHADGTLETDNENLYYYVYIASTNTWYAVQFLYTEAVPVLTLPTAAETGTTTAEGTVTTDVAAGTLYYYTSENAVEDGTTIKASGESQAVSAAGLQNVSITGLQPNTSYYVHYIQTTSGDSNIVVSAQFTTEREPSVLSLPTGASTGSTTADGTVTTDTGEGTLYSLVSENATETDATIIASGDSQAVNATGIQNVSATGLSPNTSYYYHYVQVVDTVNSNVVSSAQFTTDPAVITIDEQVFSDYPPATPYTTAGISVAILNTNLTVAQAAVVVDPDGSGNISISTTLGAGNYILVLRSADGTLLGIKDTVIT